MPAWLQSARSAMVAKKLEKASQGNLASPSPVPLAPAGYQGQASSSAGSIQAVTEKSEKAALQQDSPNEKTKLIQKEASETVCPVL